jgi:hypothetical protein
MAKPIRLLEPSEDPSGSHHTPSNGQSKILPFGGGRPPRVPDLKTLIDRILHHYRRGEGFRHYQLVPDEELPAGRETFSKTFLDQARLADLIATVVRALSEAKQGDVNPTLHLLDLLIERGVITDTDLIALILASDACLLGHDSYVVGLGWARFGIVRTPSGAPLFLPPAVRSNELVARAILVPGINEHDYVYCVRDSSQPEGMVPAYPVALRAACGLTGWQSKTLYSKLAGRRRDWRLDAARIRTRDASREVVFNPFAFWQWLFGRRR